MFLESKPSLVSTLPRPQSPTTTTGAAKNSETEMKAKALASISLPAPIDGIGSRNPINSNAPMDVLLSPPAPPKVIFDGAAKAGARSFSTQLEAMDYSLKTQKLGDQSTTAMFLKLQMMDASQNLEYNELLETGKIMIRIAGINQYRRLVELERSGAIDQMLRQARGLESRGTQLLQPKRRKGQNAYMANPSAFNQNLWDAGYKNLDTRLTDNLLASADLRLEAKALKNEGNHAEASLLLGQAEEIELEILDRSQMLDMALSLEDIDEMQNYALENRDLGDESQSALDRFVQAHPDRLPASLNPATTTGRDVYNLMVAQQTEGLGLEQSIELALANGAATGTHEDRIAILAKSGYHGNLNQGAQRLGQAGNMFMEANVLHHRANQIKHHLKLLREEFKDTKLEAMKYHRVIEGYNIENQARTERQELALGVGQFDRESKAKTRNVTNVIQNAPRRRAQQLERMQEEQAEISALISTLINSQSKAKLDLKAQHYRA